MTNRYCSTMDKSASSVSASLLQLSKHYSTLLSSSVDRSSNEKPSLSEPCQNDATTINRKAVSEALTKRRKEYSASRYSTVHQLPRRVAGGLFDTSEMTKQCNCRQSSCLKLYCECFSSGIYCSVFCTCDPCKNNDSSPANEEPRSKAILRTIEKNEHGFRPKASTVTKETFSTYTNGSVTESEMMQTEDVESSLNEDKVSKRTGGCTCQKSKCLKKYCQCFQSNLLCNPKYCRCVGCKNMLRTDQNKTNKSECSQDSTTSSNFNLGENNGRRKRLRFEQSIRSERYDLDDKISYKSLTPSFFGAPVFLNGGKEPALCFGPSSLKELKYIYCSTDNVSESNSCSQQDCAFRTGGESQLIFDRSDRSLEPYLPQSSKSVNVEFTQVPTASENDYCEPFSVSEGRLVERQIVAEKCGSKSETLNIGLHTIGKDYVISLVKEKVREIFDAIHAGKKKFKYSRELLRPSPLNVPSLVSSNDITDDQLLLCDEFEYLAMSWLSLSSTSDDSPLTSMQETAILRSLSVIVRGTALQLAKRYDKADTSSSTGSFNFGCGRAAHPRYFTKL